jgi:hypothetical protein
VFDSYRDKWRSAVPKLFKNARVMGKTFLRRAPCALNSERGAGGSDHTHDFWDDHPTSSPVDRKPFVRPSYCPSSESADAVIDLAFRWRVWSVRTSFTGPNYPGVFSSKFTSSSVFTRGAR